MRFALILLTALLFGNNVTAGSPTNVTVFPGNTVVVGNNRYLHTKGCTFMMVNDQGAAAMGFGINVFEGGDFSFRTNSFSTISFHCRNNVLEVSGGGSPLSVLRTK